MQKVIYFTVTACNYFAHAKVLAWSLRRINPHNKLHIVLLDYHNIPSGEKETDAFSLIDCRDYTNYNYDKFSEKYDLVEFATAIKPYVFKELFNKNKDVEKIFYYDPDIKIVDNNDFIESSLTSSSICVTPHALKPGSDPRSIRAEMSMLRTGTFNFGFVGFSRSTHTETCLDWWCDRLEEFCYYKPGTGMFVDQIWGNLMPAFYDDVAIIRHPGCNVAYWNLYEREITHTEKGYRVNGEPLVFFHFSSCRPGDGVNLCKRNSSFRFADYDPAVKRLYEEYYQDLEEMGYQKVKDIKCNYFRQPPVKPSFIKRVRRKITKFF